MEQLKHYVLPENTNKLYEEEASSSIGLTRDIADKINELVDALNSLAQTDLKWKQTQEGIIRKGVLFMKDNLVNSLYDLLHVKENAAIKNALVTEYGKELELLKLVDTPQMYGALGDGSQDETENLQRAIDGANKKSRVLFIPRGVYKISGTLYLNGCSLKGEVGNIFEGEGTVIECTSSNFTAISQGDTSVKNIMFNISDIMVKNADTAFEIKYAINSKFERLYAIDCQGGFTLGSSDSVGSMFCEFNNLYTSGCEHGVIINSSQFFNNNRFNNGYIQGNVTAFSMSVVGGYGAVDNVFNNVEFKSTEATGVELSNCLNTIFNNCYFECGGNAVRVLTYSTVTMNNCVYAMFLANNRDGENIIYSVGGSAFTFNGGTVFLTDEYENKYFFGAGREDTFQNVVVSKSIVKNGSATGFAFFPVAVREVMYKPQERVTLTGTVTISAGESMIVPFEYDTPFLSIPNVVLFTMRGANGTELFPIVSERTKEGGTLTVKNAGSTPLSVSFMVYAKIL